MVSTDTSLPKLVKAYRALRDKRSELKTAFEEQDTVLANKQDTIQGVLLQHCNDNDVTSVKTDEGTFFRKKKVNYWCSDWDNFYKWVVEKNIPEILQKRISQKNLKEYLGEHDDIPIGLQSNAVYTITVQKPRGR
tara:strand:+ start:1516 stop:1920 length:405 start_codon:yes stop_codon:yes gene_type:complete